MAVAAATRLTADTPRGAAPDLAAAITDWQAWLREEKRASPHTCLAYRRDLAHFLGFLAVHRGGAAGLADLEALSAADFRAWLAARAGTGLKRSSTARPPSTLDRK